MTRTRPRYSTCPRSRAAATTLGRCSTAGARRTVNINERSYKDHPFGKFAFVLQGSDPEIPAGAVKVEVPNKKSRVLSRVELGSDLEEAKRLQKEFTLTAPGNVKVDPPIAIALFTNDKLPGAEAFDQASAILASEADINSGMAPLQQRVAAVEALVKSGDEGRARVQKVIETVAWPAFKAKLQNTRRAAQRLGRPGTIGNYGEDYLSRTAINLIGIWANNTGEVVYFKTDSDGTGTKLDGGKTYAITFPADALPISKVRYFWSVIAVELGQVPGDPQRTRSFPTQQEVGVEPSVDGSLTLYFAPAQPEHAPAANWLPTPKGENYNFTFRFYGPNPDIVEGAYFPPPIKLVS